jgi:hypothetical protein
MYATITTSGPLLVNGGHSAFIPILSGSVMASYNLYHPRINDAKVHSEWLNITMSGPCVDSGSFSLGKSQNKLFKIYPGRYFTRQTVLGDLYLSSVCLIIAMVGCV